MTALWFKRRKVCPICGWEGASFRKIHYPNKPAVCLVCPSCGSFERHRFVYLVLKDTLSNYASKMLHIAPEKCLESWLQSMSEAYFSMDLSSQTAMVNMDITDMSFKDNMFSLVWCSHVLEHIENDRVAMSEMYRVLQPSGLAIIQVPIYGDKTYENPDIQSPENRIKHFKQANHVRLYGLDIVNRLSSIGFNASVMNLSSMPASDIAKYALDYPSTREVFLCRKERE